MRQVFQTSGDPPSSGSTRRAKSGSTQKRRSALVSVVRAKMGITCYLCLPPPDVLKQMTSLLFAS
jgi:hypothetical protein